MHSTECIWMDLRETLNHFKTISRIADTALEVISRCRVTSSSSRVGVGGGMGGSCAMCLLVKEGAAKGNNLREATPGNIVAAWGSGMFVPAVTVANSSLRQTRTQPDSTG